MFNSWFKAKHLSENLQVNSNRISQKDTIQRGVDSRSGNYVVRDETHPRVFLGSLQEGNDRFYGIKVSQPGSDVTTATAEDLIMSSAFNMFKIVDSGEETVPVVVYNLHGTRVQFATYTHNLGYIPIVLAFNGDTTWATTGDTWTEAYTLSTANGGTANIQNILQVRKYITVSDTTVTFYVQLSEFSGTGGATHVVNHGPIKAKFYLLRETSAE